MVKKLQKFLMMLFLPLLLLGLPSKSYAAACNWKSNNPTVLTWDSCKNTSGYAVLNGYVYFNSNSQSCFKYTWKINGTAVATGRTLYKKITQNGTYNICLTVVDTCNKCDTTFCATKNISCFGSTCNWKNRNPSFYVWDSCKNNSSANLNGEINFNFNQAGCLKYAWTVNGAAAGNSRVMHKAIYQNGTYAVCVKITDTCNKCDTSICISKTISCFSTSCNWKNRNPYMFAWDSCKNNSSANVNGYIAFNYSQSGCFKYAWTVNGAAAGDGNIMHKAITQNGTYNICVKVTDTCNKCDTTFCSSKTISCFSNTCAWYKRQIYFSAWDSCNGKKYKYSLNGYFGPQNNCYKYQWTLNGVNISDSRMLNVPISKNGTYALCLKVKDTCDRCDTTFCRSFTISCIPTCNWKNRNPYTYSWDTCKGNGQRNSVNAYISFNYSGKTCFKYTWSVNNIVINNAKSNILSYPIFKNGTYVMCVKVTDTCNNCDTSFCMYKTISCFKPCIWKNRIYTINFFDSCNGSRYANSANGYVVMNQNMNNTCLKYRWKVDNNIVSNTYYFHAPITQNGNHTYCLTIIDTCNNCDTSICQTRYYHCNNLSISSQTLNESLQVYPVPTKDVLTIQSEFDMREVSIFNISGVCLWKGELKQGENLIRLTDWPSGMYIMSAKTDNGVVTKRIFKE